MAMPYTERFIPYNAADIVRADKTPVSAAATIVQIGGPLDEEVRTLGIPMNIHRGDAQAVQQALMMGLEAINAASAFMPPEYAPYVNHHNILIDAKGSREAWTISAAGSVRTRFAETQHCRILLIQLVTQRPGFPSLS